MNGEQGAPIFFSCNRVKGEMLMAKNYEELSITDDFMFGKALAQGREEKSRFTAINLYKMAMPTTQIAQVVGESLETIERWIEESAETTSKSL